MGDKNRPTFPKGFFTQPRPHLKAKEALKDTMPFNWSKETLSGKSKVKVMTVKKKVADYRRLKVFFFFYK